MTPVIVWVALPLLLGGLSLGIGLLVELAAGVRLSGALLIPLGLAGMVVAASLATALAATAELAAPLVVGLALLGLALSFTTRRPLLDVAALAPAALAYLLFAAPTLASGKTTFAGYIKLDDTATFLALTDRVMEHGRSLAGLQPSTYEAALSVNLAHGYPVGAFLPLGIAWKLLGRDPAWLFQPTVAFYAAVLALGLWALLEPLVASRPLRALAVLVAAQPALLFGYSLWGGIKELAAAALLPLVAALVVSSPRAGVRSAVPAAVAASAVLAVLSLGGAVWLVVPLALLLRTPLRALALAGMALVLSIPVLAAAPEFLRAANADSLTSGSELGNLIAPLHLAQVLGIWPAGDFRVRPRHESVTWLLLAVVVAAAALGAVVAWRRRAWPVLVYAGGTLAACAVTVAAGSPWVDAKALAIASPCVLVLAVAGALSRRLVAAVLVVLAAGVGWSNALAYHDVSLAPDARLRELQLIGERFAGDGPALMTEYEPYGVRHFLRRLDAEGASELRRRADLLVNGSALPKGGYADTDAFAPGGLLVYRTLVLQRSPAASRPPSVYRRVWSGRYYDVWQRGAGTIVRRLALGAGLSPAAVPACRDVLALARDAGRGVLVAARGQAPIVVDRSIVVPAPGTRAEAAASVPRAAVYDVWLGGSVKGTLATSVDGDHLSTIRSELDPAGQYLSLGRARLTRGSHRIDLRYDVDALRPGGGGPAPAVGPLLLTRVAAPAALDTVPASRARSLCGRRFDWIEAVSK